MLEWVISRGRVKTLENINREEAKLIYDAINNSQMFVVTANKEDRSIMNEYYR